VSIFGVTDEEHRQAIGRLKHLIETEEKWRQLSNQSLEGSINAIWDSLTALLDHLDLELYSEPKRRAIRRKVRR
jgi:hypothetical protein